MIATGESNANDISWLLVSGKEAFRFRLRSCGSAYINLRIATSQTWLNNPVIQLKIGKLCLDDMEFIYYEAYREKSYTLKGHFPFGAPWF